MTKAATIKSGSIAAGLQWTGAAQVTRVTLQFGVTIFLARLLEPSDFGLLAMATAVTSVASMFQSLGMHGPIVQREQVTGSLVDTIFHTNLLLSTLLTIGLVAVAPWVAVFYQDPEVEPVIQVLALSLFMYALGGVPGALLRRRMRFPSIAKVSVAAGVSQSGVALVLALNGFGVWSLVLGVLAAATVQGVLHLWAARYLPRPRFSWSDLKSIAGFSVNITAVNMLDLFAKHGANLAIGRWLGAEALGYYGMSERFTRQPIAAVVRPILGPVMFPAYSRMQNDDAVSAATMRRAITGVSLVTFPALLGFALIAEPFVMGLVGEKWAPAIPLIYVLCAVGMLHGMRVAVSSIFLARDRTGVFLALRAGYAVSLLIAYAVGLQWGLIGVAVGIAVAESLLAAVELHYCARQVRMGFVSLLAGPARVAVAVAIMALAVLVARWGLAGPAMPPLVQLAGSIAVGMFTYTLAILGLRVPAVLDFARLLPAPVRAVIERVYASSARLWRSGE